MKRALIVIDMQNDFITGPLGSKEARAIVPSVKNKINEYFNSNSYIIFTRDTHDENYLETQEGKILPVKHCIYSTDGFMIHPELKNTYCSIIDKETFGFLNWKLKYPELEECEEIELCGVCTDICVISNALILKASFPEVKIVVDSKCCAGVTPESHNNALEVMKMCQIEVK